MSALFGLDCPQPGCVHTTAIGYRLWLRVRPIERPPDTTNEDWAKMREHFVMERTPTTYRSHQLDSAYAQMNLLGVDKPALGGYVVERHSSLPPGYDARMLLLQKMALPRTALYFRWQPLTDELLTPEKVFQCIFLPGSTASERRVAPERRMSEDEFNWLVRHQDRPASAPGGVTMTRTTIIKCQHCHKPLPLRALNMTALREVEKGE